MNKDEQEYQPKSAKHQSDGDTNSREKGGLREDESGNVVSTIKQ